MAPSQSMIYELYAVLVHAGSASFGHYYGLLKDLESSEWHEFNDATVKPIKESELQKTFGEAKSSSSWYSSPSAYMLLYRQRDSPGERDAAPAAGALSGRLNFSYVPGEQHEQHLVHDTKRLRLAEGAAAPSPAHFSQGDAPQDDDSNPCAHLYM